MKTVMYVLLSCVVALAGIVVVILYPLQLGEAIGTSLIAGAVTTGAFSIIRYFDDKDTAEKDGQLKRSVSLVLTRLQSLSIERSGNIKIRSRRPRQEITSVLQAIDPMEQIEVDAVGVSLQPFCADLLSVFVSRGKCKMRLLTMDPRTQVFETFCLEQARDRNVTTNEIAISTRGILILRGQPEHESKGLQIQVRWDPGFQSVTLVRVQDTMFVRTRLISRTGPDVFFDVYRTDDLEPLYYEAYRAYFEAIWQRSAEPALTDVPAATVNSPRSKTSSMTA